MHDLGTLGGSSYAVALNDRGHVVGWSSLAGDTISHAVSWTKAGGMLDLGTLGGTQSTSIAVTVCGQVVGTSDLSGDAASHAFLWTKSGGMVDLGTLGGTQSAPLGVSSTGLVVGTSTLAQGDTHAVVWTTRPCR